MSTSNEENCKQKVAYVLQIILNIRLIVVVILLIFIYWYICSFITYNNIILFIRHGLSWKYRSCIVKMKSCYGLNIVYFLAHHLLCVDHTCIVKLL